MSNTAMTATAAYLSSGGLLWITATMIVILLALKLLLKEMSHALIIVLSVGISFFLAPQGVTLFFQGKKAPAMQYIASGAVFAIIAISEASYLIAGWGRTRMRPALSTDGHDETFPAGTKRPPVHLLHAAYHYLLYCNILFPYGRLLWVLGARIASPVFRTPFPASDGPIPSGKTLLYDFGLEVELPSPCRRSQRLLQPRFRFTQEG